MTGRPAERGLASAALLPALACVASPGNPSDPADPANTNWAFLGNSAEMQHHSELDEIDTETVGDLGLVWSVDLPTADGLVGNPLIQDGRIFQSGSRSQVFANDLRTGKLLWTYEPMANAHVRNFMEAYAQRLNRGVALHDDLVIVATAAWSRSSRRAGRNAGRRPPVILRRTT